MENAKELKIYRIRSGIKQIDLAIRLGISPSQLSKIENGYAECTEELKKEILKIVTGKEELKCAE